MVHEPIQALWIGDSLSPLERLSMMSFVACGHPYHLYTYSIIPDIPIGVATMNANEIIPEERIFRHQSGKHAGSLAAFSDWFRFELLYRFGGWWADTDVVCLKPLNFPQELVLASERT